MDSKRKLAYFGIGLAMFLLAFVLWVKGNELISNNEKNVATENGANASENIDETSINEEMTADELESAYSEDNIESMSISIDENVENSANEEVVAIEPVEEMSEISDEKTEENVSSDDSIDNVNVANNIIDKIGNNLVNVESYRYKISIDVIDFKKAKNDLSEEDRDSLPSNGYLLVSTNYEVVSQDTAISLLKKACRDYGIDLVLDDAENKVKAIGTVGNTISDDAFSWKYSINGEVENKNAAEYKLKQGDILRWFYSGE